jgi:hypothetical protein
MGLGWGALKHMIDVTKYNRDLLGKKKTPKELYRDELKRKGTKYSNQDINEIRQRVEKKLRRNRTEEFIARIVALSLLTAIVVGTIWAIASIDFSVKVKPKEIDKRQLFTTFTGTQPNGLELQTDYYHQGAKAADTFYKNGLKHQNSESYYETGEQFRSALYFYDSLITEVYFYKTGDTIPNFPKIKDDDIHRIKVLSKDKTKQIEFDFYDGKIIKGTYKELEIK